MQAKQLGKQADVSIPFRAVTGFEPDELPFLSTTYRFVSIPFRAVTGFELFRRHGDTKTRGPMFQSLSGLSLGLNPFRNGFRMGAECFNPFQGCHWV